MVDQGTAPEPGWRVKYDGVCARCGAPLLRGQIAVWDRAARSMHCVECPSGAEQIEADAAPSVDVGLAGASARREHVRRVAKRETKTRARWGDRIGGAILKLTSDPQSTRAWRIGAEGEEKLAAALAEVETIAVLNDRRVKGTRGNIDHILVAPAGVFVVDAKNYRGLIRVRDRGGLLRTDLRLYVGRRDCSHLAQGLHWQVEAVSQVLAVAGVDLRVVVPVLCFVDGEWPLFRRPKTFDGVRLEGIRSLRKLVTATERMDAAAIHRLTAILATALPAK